MRVAGSVLGGDAKLGKAASECKYTREVVFIKLSYFLTSYFGH